MASTISVLGLTTRRRSLAKKASFHRNLQFDEMVSVTSLPTAYSPTISSRGVEDVEATDLRGIVVSGPDRKRTQICFLSLQKASSTGCSVATHLDLCLTWVNSHSSMSLEASRTIPSRLARHLKWARAQSAGRRVCRYLAKKCM